MAKRTATKKRPTGELRETSLKRSALVGAEEVVDLVPDGESAGLHVAVGSSLAVGVALDIADLLCLGGSAEGVGDLADLGVHARTHDDTRGAGPLETVERVKAMLRRSPTPTSSAAE
ncbi:hypothetical protein L1887_59319 [Cichorium endivia]|nr:hypothetical protein L1887_59319 [Cichorium endivia]